MLPELLLEQIKKSYGLPKLTAKGEEYCKLSHELEIPFITQALKHSTEGISCLDWKGFIVAFAWKGRVMKCLQRLPLITLVGH